MLIERCDESITAKSIPPLHPAQTLPGMPIAQTAYQSGLGADTLWVRVSDGEVAARAAGDES